MHLVSMAPVHEIDLKPSHHQMWLPLRVHTNRSGINRQHTNQSVAAHPHILFQNCKQRRNPQSQTCLPSTCVSHPSSQPKNLTDAGNYRRAQHPMGFTPSVRTLDQSPRERIRGAVGTKVLVSCREETVRSRVSLRSSTMPLASQT
jgi:hypothetical protein